ncbi:hypothetical protein PIB30_069286, partial [Stylosanthes scabra]|nr:hypothetical protein [Stylosanthes scabra]
MVDASTGGALMDKTPEEAWELIESMADNNQHFKVRATSTAKGVFEVTPLETTILTKSLVDMAAMLKEIKEGQQVAPKLLTRQANHSQQYQPPHVRQTYPSPNTPPPNYEETLRAYQQDSREMKEKQQRLESQLSHITDMLHKFTNQPNVNVQSQPSTSSPLPSQPLPNPKGGINMVHNEVTQKQKEEKEEDDDWLYELLAELANSDDEDNNEEAEEESEKEADEDDIEGETEGKTFFIATIFNKDEEAKTVKTLANRRRKGRKTSSSARE